MKKVNLLLALLTMTAALSFAKAEKEESMDCFVPRNDAQQRPVRDKMLVENITNTATVVPSGTICDDGITSLTGLQMPHDTIFSTNIKSLTGLNVIANEMKQSRLQGEYIIGSSAAADFATFAAAVNAAQNGIDGAVMFKIEPGIYNENVLVTNIAGVSAVNTVTFTSLSGNNDDVIIRGGNLSLNYVFKIEGTSYVTVENLSIIPTNQNYEFNFYVYDGSRYCTLRNCILTKDLITTPPGIYSSTSLVRVGGPNEEGRNSDYFTAEGNVLTGAYIGFYINGTGYVALSKQVGAVIRNNVVINQHSKGIYVADERDAVVENNVVNSATTLYTGFWGIDVYRNIGEVIVRNNVIVISQNVYSFGMQFRTDVVGNPAVLVYNNSISITNSPNAYTYGILVDSDCENIEFYHNSINISGANGICFGTSRTYSDIANMVFKNNLLQNNTASGLVYYFNRPGHCAAFTFGNNAYFSGNAFAEINQGETYANFDAWAVATNDLNSFVEHAEFVSAFDLHLMDAGGLNAGLPVSFITTDADGTPRSTTVPTIGAYEYGTIVIDVPEIEDGYPKTGSVTYNSIEFKTKWNQTGKLYGMIKKASETAPTETDLLATTPVNVSGEVEHTWTFNNLVELTDYKAYFIFVSAFDIESEIVETDVVSTLKEIFELEITLPEVWDIVVLGTEVEIVPEVSGSVSPYIYEWRNPMNEVISNEAVLTVSPAVTQQYKLTVRGSDEQSKTAYTAVLVRGEAAVATFEDNYLNAESYWQGRPLYEKGEEAISKFYSGSYSFSNTHAYWPDSWTEYWGGFGYANLTATDFDFNQYLTHQFRSVTGHGVDNSSTYSVVYLDVFGFGIETNIEVIHTNQATTVPGVYLTNAAWTYDNIVNGDLFMDEPPFGQGDYYKVIFTGNTGTRVECYLADFRSNNADEHFVLTDWKWFDLSTLGNITGITVSVAGSRTGQFGLNTAAYFCMDNFGAEDPESRIKNISQSNALTAWTQNGMLYVSGLTEGKTWNVYNLSGTLIYSSVANSDKANISLPERGVYIIQSDNRRIKVVLK